MAIFRLRRILIESCEDIDVLFVLSGADFQTPSSNGLKADKIELWKNELIRLGMKTIIVIHPFSPTQWRKMAGDPFYIESVILSSLLMPSQTKAKSGNRNKHSRGKQGMHGSIGSRLHYKIWMRFLMEVQPKAVIGIGIAEVLLLACRDLNIMTIEVQHGTWNNDSVSLRKFWPGAATNHETIPDLILTWHDYYSQIANSVGLASLTVGYPHNFSKSSSSETQIESLSEKNHFRIIVTLAWGVNPSLDPFGMIDLSLDRAILELFNSNFEVVLRVHPVAEIGLLRRWRIGRWLKKRYRAAEVNFSSQQGILDLLRTSDLHLTNASAAVLEAAYLGVPSLCLSEGNISWLPQKIYEMGMARTTSAETILKDIQQVRSMHKGQFENSLKMADFRTLIQSLRTL